MTTTSSARARLAQLAADREQIIHDLARISEEECRLPADWAGLHRNVNFMLRAFSLHEIDHLQHLTRLLAKRGRTFTEPAILLSKAEALRGELMALLLSLSDEEFDSNAGIEGDWSPRQIVEHLSDVDRGYATTIREAIAAGRAARAANH